MKTLICIPVFNGASYIEKSIKSCLSQTVKVEIWVFDNCSTDDTCEIVNQYLSKHKNIKLFVNEKNLGREGNWNRCLDRFMDSHYEYIKFLNPGDEIFIDCIDKVEKIFDKYKNLGAVYFPYELNTKGKSVIYRAYNKDKIFNSKEITKIQLAEGSQLGAGICNVYSRHAISNHRWNENYISKVEFDIRVLENHSLYYINECLACFLTEAHNTVGSFVASWVFFEFSYILGKERERMKKLKLFSESEFKKIEQLQILKGINDQMQFLNKRSKFVLLLSLIKHIIIIFLKNFKNLFKLFFKI
jgi:glycosyltransferase involved in cell wall biosynthesis